MWHLHCLINSWVTGEKVSEAATTKESKHISMYRSIYILYFRKITCLILKSHILDPRRVSPGSFPALCFQSWANVGVSGTLLAWQGATMTTLRVWRLSQKRQAVAASLNRTNPAHLSHISPEWRKLRPNRMLWSYCPIMIHCLAAPVIRLLLPSLAFLYKFHSTLISSFL